MYGEFRRPISISVRIWHGATCPLSIWLTLIGGKPPCRFIAFFKCSWPRTYWETNYRRIPPFRPRSSFSSILSSFLVFRRFVPLALDAELVWSSVACSRGGGFWDAWFDFCICVFNYGTVIVCSFIWVFRSVISRLISRSLTSSFRGFRL